MKILGVLPLAGSGVRLGAHFHKSLMPFPLNGTIVPIVQTSITRLNLVTEQIVSVVSVDSRFPFPSSEFGLQPLEKESQGELPTSVRRAAEHAIENGFSHIAVSLPDTYWTPENAFQLLVDELERNVELDGALGLFHGDLRMLDAVHTKGDTNIVESVTLHLNQSHEPVFGFGWGVFVLTAECATKLSDELPLADQLTDLRLAAVALEGEYFDIGTPDRYFEAVKRYS